MMMISTPVVGPSAGGPSDTSSTAWIRPPRQLSLSAVKHGMTALTGPAAASTSLTTDLTAAGWPQHHSGCRSSPADHPRPAATTAQRRRQNRTRSLAAHQGRIGSRPAVLPVHQRPGRSMVCSSWAHTVPSAARPAGCPGPGKASRTRARDILLEQRVGVKRGGVEALGSLTPASQSKRPAAG